MNKKDTDNGTLAIKKKLPLVATQTDLEGFILSEISQRETQIPRNLTHM